MREQSDPRGAHHLLFSAPPPRLFGEDSRSKAKHRRCPRMPDFARFYTTRTPSCRGMIPGHRMPSPLDTRPGRLLTFFLLYVTEGIPQGFAVGAVVTYMRRAGLTPDAIGSFSALVLLPWA